MESGCNPHCSATAKPLICPCFRAEVQPPDTHLLEVRLWRDAGAKKAVGESASVNDRPSAKGGDTHLASHSCALVIGLQNTTLGNSMINRSARLRFVTAHPHDSGFGICRTGLISRVVKNIPFAYRKTLRARSGPGKRVTLVLSGSQQRVRATTVIAA